MQKENKQPQSSAENTYDQAFFDTLQGGSLQSAREIVPLVVEFLHPQSVIDVGCGMGAWLSVFSEQGIKDINGVDGDYVDLESLLIPKDRFISHDLTKPLQLERKFDLVISLEVAEHLPSKFAEIFVESLTHLGHVIMFSAAIPFQGGTHHVNEQWQDYWKELFKKKGFLAVDFIRKRVWKNERVGVWYAQNTLLYVQKNYMESHSEIQEERGKTIFPLSVVHPTHYENCVLLNNIGLRKTLLSLPRLILKAMIRKLRSKG